MKHLQKWGVAFWLVVLLCVSWSMAEAGRPVYLSDYLTLWNVGTKWICIPADTAADEGVEAWEITLESSGQGNYEYKYLTGTLKWVYYPPPKNYIVLEFVADIDPETGTFFSYTVGSTITFDRLCNFSLKDCEIDDREPTNKLIPVTISEITGNPAIEFSFLMGSKTIDGYDLLGISLQDTSLGTSKSPHILGEVQFSSDPDYGGIMSFKVRDGMEIKEFVQFDVLPVYN